MGESAFVRFAIVVGIRRFAVAMVGFTHPSTIGRLGMRGHCREQCGDQGGGQGMVR